MAIAADLEDAVGVEVMDVAGVDSEVCKVGGAEGQGLGAVVARSVPRLRSLCSFDTCKGPERDRGGSVYPLVQILVRLLKGVMGARYQKHA